MRILHTADTHLGFRQYGLQERRDDFFKAFQQVIDIAVDREVGALVHAGDLFDNRFPSTEDLVEIFGELSRLKASGIPFLGVAGNHDGKRGKQWLDLFGQLGLAIHLNPTTPYDLNGVPVWGMDYVSRHRQQVKPPQVEGGILVMHQMLDAVAVPREQGELVLEDLFQCGARLVLLGDYHEHRDCVWRQPGVVVSYCGSTERFSSGEKERRGFSIFNYETLDLERHELDTRRFLYLGSAREPLADPVAELEAQAHLVRGAVVVIEVGNCPLTPRQLQEEATARGALYVRVKRTGQDQSTPSATMAQLPHIEQVDQAISSALKGESFSPLARRVDDILRDPSVLVSHVDKRTTELLDEADL